MVTFNTKTVSANGPSGKSVAADELECIYAICELARRDDAELLSLPTIQAERKHPRHGHYHFVERLDFDVHYHAYPIVCSAMRRVSSRIVVPADQIEGCLRDVAHYGPLISHLQGAGQQRDIQAFIEADLADVDVFLSLDGKFINPFRQIESKLRDFGVRTRVMRPSELCSAAELQSIPFPPPNPRQSRGSPAPER